MFKTSSTPQKLVILVFKNKNLSFFLWAEIANIYLCIVVLEPKEKAFLVNDIKETIKFATLNKHFLGIDES